MKVNYIPLYSDLVINHSTQLYYWCGLISQATQFNAAYELEWTAPKVSKIIAYLNISKHAYYSHAVGLFEMPLNMREHNDFVEMPMELWIDLHNQLTIVNHLSTQECTTITRVLCFLYYEVCRFAGSFSCSRDNLVKALKIQPTRLSQTLIWLEAHNFIGRTVYIKPKNGEEGVARTYTIAENYLNERCKTLRMLREKELKKC